MKWANIKKIKFNMSWKTVIISAIVLGIYTGVMALIPATADTSFRDISISFEWWILFGILIIMGSRSNKNAALKCFVFFLISQPLVYLTQICFGAGWDIFRYYSRWFIWTVLTLPMGYFGYYMKKDNLIGLLILSPILVLLGWHIYTFFGEVISFFPNHLLSLIFCIVTLYGYVFGIFSHKRERIIGTIFCSLILVVCVVANLIQGQSTYSTTVVCDSTEAPFDDSFEVKLENPSFGNLNIETKDFGSSIGYCINADFKRTGQTKMIITNGTTQYVFNLTIERNSYSIEQVE